EAARHYGDTRSALRRSDKLIEASVEEYEELHNSVGEERALRHVYSDTVHLGVVKNVEGQTVVMEKNDEEVTLKTENVELLTRDEMREWKIRNLPKVERDVSVVFDRTVDEDVLETVAEDTHADVLEADVFDVYDGDAIPDGSVSYTLRLEILDDGNVDEAVEGVRGVFEGLGGELR
ncbi:MAG: prephenate dehydrogenase, partial [Halobacteria archaeon]|nr:prephenate dehydrogenase [Halobacteria archaeon]